MITALMCEACSRQAGEATTMAELHRSYVGSPFGAVVVVKARQQDSHGRWFATAGTGVATTTGDPRRPADWPARWACPRCDTQLVLERDTAGRIGRQRRLVVPTASGSISA